MLSTGRVNVVSPSQEMDLSDTQVLVRPYRCEDMEALYAAARESTGEVGRWLPWCHENYVLADSTAWVESRAQAWREGAEYSFAIMERASGRFVGGCGLNQFDYERMRCNLGYWTRTGATRRGLATAAAKLLARWGMERLGLERIEIIAAVGNIASQRVALKLGAVREGIARNRIRIHGQQHHAVVFSLIRSDVLEGSLSTGK